MRFTASSPITRLAGLSLAVSALTLAGCSSSEMQASAGDPRAMFMADTAHASTSEIAASQIAQQRATDPRVRQFAAMMIQDHTNGNQQLQQVAQAKGTDLPMRPDEEHTKAAAYLQNLQGTQFDQEYMSMMVADHAKLLSKFQDKAVLSQDPDVRAYAQSQIPIIQHHLDSAREINRSLGGGSTITVER